MVVLFLMVVTVGADEIQPAVSGGVWTNTAGHAFKATLLRLEGTAAVFRLPDGSERRLALAALHENSRARVRQELALIDVPSPLQTDFDQARRLLARLRNLRDSDRISHREYDERRQLALAVLDRAGRRQNMDAEDLAAVLDAVTRP